MRYLIGLIITVGLIILLIILIFRGGNQKAPTAPSNKSLSSYATTDAQTIMTIEGPINANSLHQGIRVTVDHDNVTFETLTGYDGNVTELKNFSNSTSAYQAFLSALNNLGFKEVNKKYSSTNVEGTCPLGTRTIFQLVQDQQQVVNSWTTSCGFGTYAGAIGSTTTLFQNQVPGYSQLSQNFNSSM